MLSPKCPDRIHVAFDDHGLAADAGLLLSITLARHLGLANWWTAKLIWGAVRMVSCGRTQTFWVGTYWAWTGECGSTNCGPNRGV